VTLPPSLRRSPPTLAMIIGAADGSIIAAIITAHIAEALAR
jgi:hypothetical protein